MYAIILVEMSSKDPEKLPGIPGGPGGPGGPGDPTTLFLPAWNISEMSLLMTSFREIREIRHTYIFRDVMVHLSRRSKRARPAWRTRWTWGTRRP